jgi:Fe-S-cluster-containing hydrogenase component 2
MAFKIIEGCINCWACEPLCPSGAIYLPAVTAPSVKPHFRIDAKKCTECQGDYSDPQCASICPVEEVILDGNGLPTSPPGSLTGIPPAQVAEGPRWKSKDP